MRTEQTQLPPVMPVTAEQVAQLLTEGRVLREALQVSIDAMRIPTPEQLTARAR